MSHCLVRISDAAAKAVQELEGLQSLLHSHSRALAVHDMAFGVDLNLVCVALDHGIPPVHGQADVHFVIVLLGQTL